MNTVFEQIFEILFDMYGPQGWWPLLKKQKGEILCAYHPGNYDLPQKKIQIFEICLGAILTQNTSWQNVIKALINLYQLDSLRPRTIEKMPMDDLGQAIRPAGYFNQKAKKIKAFTAFYLQLNGKVPTRDQLLNVWGIGPETADSILLYAYKVASFVIDAYTRRIFVNIGLIQDHLKYHDIKKQFENNLKKDIFIYQEYHALIVTHAKAYYSKKDLYAKDPLLTSAKVNLIK